MKSCLFLPFLFILCQGYINDFYINVTFPGYNATRSFIIDTIGDDDFIWQTKAYGGIIGEENTFDEKKSKTYHGGGYYFRTDFVDGGKNCRIGGMMSIDDVSLLPYKNYNAYFGLAYNSTCGENALHRTTAFNGKVRAGRLSFRKFENPNQRKVGLALVDTFPHNYLCLHQSVTDDLKIRQTAVAVGAKVANNRVIGEIRYYKDSYWRVPATTLKIGKTEYDVQPWSNLATFDTTSDKITLPIKYFELVANATNAVYINETKKYMVDCGQEVALEIGLDKLRFKIQPTALLRREKADYTKCELLLKPGTSRTSSYFTLGVPFFVNNGVCFGRLRMIFYNAKYDQNKPVFPDTWGAYLSIRNE
ncbi:unnamed protein product [Bursaphelenchus xylophilus]|uniref:(pine wood nematode) hypothetical protein n=1 Tax=Bursaphelenchus xylophilus TaxID=6326 RepID=A0A1I7S2F4_BURXY|nr:unnamed protein product [Bursaphelenchus xylophilus]CAG9114594.1 unnamed protein product [Bursaphelenchus xylophilus]